MSMQLIDGVYIADTARVLGEVVLGKDVNIWYGVSIRGDVAPISIGQGANIQDNAVIHCDYDVPHHIGSYVSIGHSAVVHGTYIGDYSLIAMGAVVLAGSRIGSGSIVAAGAVVPTNMEVPEGVVVMGIPGKVVRPTNEQEQAALRDNPMRYIQMAKFHHDHPTDKRIAAWGRS